MREYINRQLAAGRVYETEAELVKSLNGLRGWLTRQGTLSKNWKQQQAAILRSFRMGKLVAPPMKKERVVATAS
jgi:hypothetical protein